MRTSLAAFFGGLIVASAPALAHAQPGAGLPFIPQVETTRVEAVLGLSVNSLAIDVNAPSRCRTFDRPCRSDEPNSFGGFGLDATVGVNLSDRYAAVFAGHAHAHEWSSGQPASTSQWNTTRTLLAGSRIQSDWLSGPRIGREPARFFVQALAGVGHSTATGRHPVVQIGGGVDGMSLVRSRSTNQLVDLTIRLSVDYRIPLTSASDLRGVQFGFAVVIGPHR